MTQIRQETFRFANDRAVSIEAHKGLAVDGVMLTVYSTETGCGVFLTPADALRLALALTESYGALAIFQQQQQQTGDRK